MVKCRGLKWGTVGFEMGFRAQEQIPVGQEQGMVAGSGVLLDEAQGCRRWGWVPASAGRGPRPQSGTGEHAGTGVRGCGGAAPSSGLCPPVTPRSLARLEVPSLSVCLAKSLPSALFRAPPALKSADVAISSP